MLLRIIAVGALLLAASAAADSHAVRGVKISVVAGSGRSGAADGPATTATFVMPAALAADAHGNLYVADAGAQRIRVVSPGGVVRTLAGSSLLQDAGLWGTPGNRDGPAASAQFNTPSGIAVGRDGFVYVADTVNHSIRRISNAGVVTTFVPALGLPRGLAFDDDGNLYVADSELGLLKIAPNGTVTGASEPSVAFPVLHPYGVVIFEHPFMIVVSDDHGIMVQQQDGVWIRISSDATSGVPVQENQPIGQPYELARIGPDSIVYTDPRTGTIRYMNLNTRNEAILADVAEPLGIAALPGGEIAFTSAATRQVERLDGFDARDVIDPIFDAAPARRGAAYRVLEIGNSFTWWGNTWQDSIANMIEHGLGARTEVVPVQMAGAQLAPIISYVDETAPLFDAVILHVDDGTLGDVLLNEGPAAWKGHMAASLRALRDSLERQHVLLFVVERPMPNFLGPTEHLWAKIQENALAPPDRSQQDAWDAALAASGVHWIDLWSAYMADIRSARHEEIYSADAHLTEHGRIVTANAIVNALRPLIP